MSIASDRKIRVVAAAAVTGVLVVALLGAGWLIADGRSQLLETNSVPVVEPVVSMRKGASRCVSTVVPHDAGETRIWASARVKATLGVIASDSDGRVVEGSTRVEGDVLERRIRLRAKAVKPASKPMRNRVCLTSDRNGVFLHGTAVASSNPAPNSQRDSGLIRIEFFTGEAMSNWSQISKVITRASLFRPGWVGPWTFFVLLALALVLIPVVAFVFVRHGVHGLPVRRWAVLIALVSVVNGLAWSVVTPPFHVPDEQEHFAYIDTLSNRGLPGTVLGEPPGAYTERFNALLRATFFGVALYPENKPPWTRDEERQWRATDRRLAHETDASGVSSAAQYPPIYYAAAVLPYKAAGGDLIARDWAIRLLSIAMTAFAAVLAFLTGRLVARDPQWFAPTVGLTVAFLPMLSHIGAAAHPDALVNLLGCSLIYLSTLVLRRGLSLRRCLAIGGLFGLMVSVKPVGAGLAPALVLTAGIAVRRDGRKWSRAAVDLLPAVLTAIFVFGFFAIAFDGGVRTGSSLVSGDGSLMPFSIGGMLSYAWQWFLPPLEFMFNWFGSDLFWNPPPIVSIVLTGFIANFNHLDTNYPFAFYRALALVLILMTAVIAGAAIRARSKISELIPIAAISATAVGGLLAFLILSAYLMAIKSNSSLIQGRYMLPLVTIAGLFVAAFARAFGSRRGLVPAAVVVVSIAILNLFSYGLALDRFYL